MRSRWPLVLILAFAGGAVLGPALVMRDAPEQTAAPPPAAVRGAATLTSLRAGRAVPEEGTPEGVDASRRTAIVRAAERVSASVVGIRTVKEEPPARSLWDEMFLQRRGPRMGLGSGFIISAEGLVLTNEHVVRGASEVRITLGDGRVIPVEVVGFDQLTDLALLRPLEPPATRLAVAPIGSSTELLIGEWVVAIGNPYGSLLANPEPTVTAGVVSGVGRNIIPQGNSAGGYYLDMIQTDASINPGNSGGPLVNALGQVVGVNSSILSETGGNVGLGFAIPIDRALRIAEDLLERGSARRVWVGVDVTESGGDAWQASAVVIHAVAPGSPAEAAGLQPGWVIRGVGERPVRTVLDWEARLLDARVGESLQVAVHDGRRERTLRLDTRDLPSITAARVRALREFDLVTLTPAIRSERDLRSERGALVVGLTDAARGVGFRAGDLIVAINRMPVQSAEDAARLMERVAGRGTILAVVERAGRAVTLSFSVRG